MARLNQGVVPEKPHGGVKSPNGLNSSKGLKRSSHPINKVFTVFTGNTEYSRINLPSIELTFLNLLRVGANIKLVFLPIPSWL